MELSMNILGVGDKLPVQRGFFKNSMVDLLLTLRFLGGLYHFCNFVIIFSLMLQWYVEMPHILQIWKWFNTTKKCVAEIASLQKFQNYVNN